MSRYRKFVLSREISEASPGYTATSATKSGCAPEICPIVASVARSRATGQEVNYGRAGAMDPVEHIVPDAQEQRGGVACHRSASAGRREALGGGEVKLAEDLEGHAVQVLSTRGSKSKHEEAQAGLQEWMTEWGWVNHLDMDDLPGAPFLLHRSVRVINKKKFLRHLQADVVQGPSGPRARTGALQSNCKRLREVLDEQRKGAGHGQN